MRFLRLKDMSEIFSQIRISATFDPTRLLLMGISRRLAVCHFDQQLIVVQKGFNFNSTKQNFSSGY